MERNEYSTSRGIRIQFNIRQNYCKYNNCIYAAIFRCTFDKKVLQAFSFLATEKNVVRIGLMDKAAIISRNVLSNAAFLLSQCAHSLWAGWAGSRKACRRLTGRPTCSVPPAPIGLRTGGSFDELKAHIMTHIDLVPVFTGIIQNQSIQLCSARDLHYFLESQQQFSDWIKNRIEQYGFIVDEDYFIKLCNRSDGKAGKRRTEYHLTLDMAKELAMVENNEKCRQIRRYFISLERTSKPALPNQLKERIQKLEAKYQPINPSVWTRPAPSCGEGNGRSIEVAKKLITELKVWSNTLPRDVASPLWDALDDLFYFAL
jgi:phage anti-repressor protein